MSTETVAETDPAAGLTPGPPWRVNHVEALPGHMLRLRFRDGLTGTANLGLLVAAEDAGVFAALRDEHEFAAVRLDLGAPTWPNGADLDPCWLYDAIRERGAWDGK